MRAASVQAAAEKAQGDIMHVYKHLVVGNEDERVRLLSIAIGRTRGNGRKLKHMKFLLNSNKHLFTVRVDKHWKRLPREFVESAFMEILKTKVDMVLGNLVWLTLLEQGGGTR